MLKNTIKNREKSAIKLPLNETKAGTGDVTKEQRNKDTGYWFSREPDAVIAKISATLLCISFFPLSLFSCTFCNCL